MIAETLKSLLQRAESWPTKDLTELLAYARIIEARRAELYLLSEAERVAIAKGIEDANHKAFVRDGELGNRDRRRRGRRLCLTVSASAERLSIYLRLLDESRPEARDFLTQLDRGLKYLFDAVVDGWLTEVSDVRVLFGTDDPYKIFYRLHGETVEVLHVGHAC